jgi:hypothetical protein
VPCRSSAVAQLFSLGRLCTRLVSSPPDWLARLQNVRADWLHSTFWFMCCSVYAEATSLAIRSVPEYMRGQFGHRMGFMIHTTRHQVPSLPQADATAHIGVASGLFFCHCGYLIFPMFTNLGHRKYRPNKSPEPTAVGAVRSAVAVHAASRRWLSFFR